MGTLVRSANPRGPSAIRADCESQCFPCYAHDPLKTGGGHIERTGRCGTGTRKLRYKLACSAAAGVSKKVKKLLHPSDRERIVHPLAHTDQVEAAFFFLMRNVSAHQRADTRGVHVRDLGEIQKQGAGLVGPNLGLEVEQVTKNKRPVKSEYTLSIFRASEVFNDKRLLRHREILVPPGC